MNKKQKRLALGLVLAGLLGTGTAWASPLEQGVKPAETVLLDETDGPLSHVQKKKQDTKEKVQRKEEVRKTEEEQEKKPLSFRERIRRHRKEEDKKDRKQKKARDLQEKKPAREEKTHTAKPPKKEKRRDRENERPRTPVIRDLGPADQDSLVIRKGMIAVVGERLTLPQWPDPDKLLKLENQDRVITDPSLQIIINHLTTRAKIWELPDNYQEVTIAGPGEATRDQAVVLLRRYNPKLPIKATPEQIVDLYYQEASREGLRWDIVFCQALLETGFFRFGGTVVPAQNNFCGLGTTSATVQGAWFPTPRDGVRAHVQHLMAYTTDRLPATPVIDPRYYLVYKGKVQNGFYTRWSQLNGKWATGSYYAEKILNLHEQMKKIIAISGNDWDGGVLK
ncbi:glucosaminidase domain-containing protein [Acidaminococcus fermentans]|uniref:glucosaminidase domain-containing protein n=1 Tax=Acidaminococcus fermentans TaxID=905 RepID=UPI002E767337|nr:glucosaminidase domain-containing protein [Acidaminococcus fermentans]MEE1598950.1 glucosaminidase domain-containing protein [Acidaminococcus fermentans]MEE4123212.1 glucosaminidase domain-containing protein [Acidaminococcus fermentans]